MRPSRSLRFGVIADPQYADVPPENGRDFRASLGKLRSAIATLNLADLDFAVTLGDVIDRDWASFDAVLDVYGCLRLPHYHVLGNHDFSVDRPLVGAVPGRLGMSRRYHDFACRGFRFVVLDQTETSVFATQPGTRERADAEAVLNCLRAKGAPNAMPWNGGISEGQFAWLRGVLDGARSAGEPVVVLGHWPLLPEGRHTAWGGERLARHLADDGNVLLYLNGHDHDGGYALLGATHFVTIEAMVDTTDDTAFAVVEIDGNRIRISGYGRARSRDLTAPTV